LLIEQFLQPASGSAIIEIIRGCSIYVGIWITCVSLTGRIVLRMIQIGGTVELPAAT
jgi:hypothetical protein